MRVIKQRNKGYHPEIPRKINSDFFSSMQNNIPLFWLGIDGHVYEGFGCLWQLHSTSLSEDKEIMHIKYSLPKKITSTALGALEIYLSAGEVHIDTYPTSDQNGIVESGCNFALSND
ncbi:hypothetical protein ACJX0J_035514 [Zea mays]